MRQAVGQASGVPVWDGAWWHDEVRQVGTRKQWPKGLLAPGCEWKLPGGLEQFHLAAHGQSQAKILLFFAFWVCCFD